MPPTLEEKADAILAEGRLLIEAVAGTGPTALVVASCLSSDGSKVYKLGHDPRNDQWRCTCIARRRCSHLTALRKVVIRDAAVHTTR